MIKILYKYYNEHTLNKNSWYFTLETIVYIFLHQKFFYIMSLNFSLMLMNFNISVTHLSKPSGNFTYELRLELVLFTY